MRIDKEKCIGCGICIPYCPANAIKMVDDKAEVNEDECFECGNCSRERVVRCPQKAFIETPGLYNGPRTIRKFFSDPMTTHTITKIPGRGTEEVKTNDVTGRVVKKEIGIAVEMGRPCLGTRVYEVEKVTMALAPLEIEFEEMNPLTHLMEDRTKGTIKDKYKNEKLLSCIIEFTAEAEILGEVMEVIKEVSQKIDTVFSLDLIYCFEDDLQLPVLDELEQMGIKVYKNAKINLGLGRPPAPKIRERSTR